MNPSSLSNMIAEHFDRSKYLLEGQCDHGKIGYNKIR